MSDIPVSDVDLYTDEARIDPYPIYEELRRARSGRAPVPVRPLRAPALQRGARGPDGLADVLLGPQRVRRPDTERPAGGHHAMQ